MHYWNNFKQNSLDFKSMIFQKCNLNSPFSFLEVRRKSSKQYRNVLGISANFHQQVPRNRRSMAFFLTKNEKGFSCKVNTSSTNCRLRVDACDQNHGIFELFCLVIVNSTRNSTPLTSVIRISFLPYQSFFLH